MKIEERPSQEKDQPLIQYPILRRRSARVTNKEVEVRRLAIRSSRETISLALHHPKTLLPSHHSV